MIYPEPSQPSFTCPHCGCQILVESEHWGSTGLCSCCGKSVTLPDSDIPEQFAIAVETDLRRNEDVFRNGAICGGLCYGVVLLLFTVLPAIGLLWNLQGSWPLIIVPVINLLKWTFFGALAGGALLWLVSATLASSWASKRGAAWGMAIGFVAGALLGAGGQTIDNVWLAQGGQVANTSIAFGSVFACFGCLAGSLLSRPPKRVRPSDTEAPIADHCERAPKSRYQFGIARILILSAAVALVIAIPAQLLVRVMRVSQLGRNAIAFEIMIVLCVLLMLTVVTWFVMRGPAVYSQLARTLARWRGLKRNRDELKRWASNKK